MSERSVYDVLSKVDVSEYVTQKGNFDYVSWVHALHLLKEKYPSAGIDVQDFDGQPYTISDAGAFVCITAYAGGAEHTEWFPVLDNRNKAIKKPDAFDINNSLKRGMAKAIAGLGLGLSVYAGEDLVQYDSPAEAIVETISADQIKELKALVKAGSGTKPSFFERAGYSTFEEIPVKKFDGAVKYLNSLLPPEKEEDYDIDDGDPSEEVPY